MSDELKPCPWCGDTVFVACTELEIRCKRCYVVAKNRAPLQTPGTELDFWNNRPIEDALRAEIATLQDGLHHKLYSRRKLEEDNAKFRVLLEEWLIEWQDPEVSDILERPREALR